MFRGRKKNGKDARGLIVDIYFDVNGKSITPAKFSQMYPHGRVMISQSRVCGLDLFTEFVGINHSPDPDSRPLIFETILSATDGKRERILTSHWSSTVVEARDYHRRLKRFIAYGGLVFYYLWDAIRRAWR